MNMKWLAGSATALVLLGGVGAHAGMEVIDPTSIAQEAKITSEVVKNGGKLQEGLEQGEMLLDRIGDLKSVGAEVTGNLGVLKDAANAALESCGIGAFIPDIPSSFGIDLPNLPDLSCVTDSIDFVQQTMYASQSIGVKFGLSKSGAEGQDLTLSGEDIEQLKLAGNWSSVKTEIISNRRKNYQDFVQKGLAAAYQARATGMDSAAALKLQVAAAAATDDYATLARILSAQLAEQNKELAQIRMLLGMQVGIDASREILTIPVENTANGESGGGVLETAFTGFQ